MDILSRGFLFGFDGEKLVPALLQNHIAPLETGIKREFMKYISSPKLFHLMFVFFLLFLKVFASFFRLQGHCKTSSSCPSSAKVNTTKRKMQRQ